MNNFEISAKQITNSALIGPGSQPNEVDGSVLDIMQLPDGMSTFIQPELPEAEQVKTLKASKRILRRLWQTMKNGDRQVQPLEFEITELDQANKQFIDQVLGEGEVSIKFQTHDESIRLEIQESVLAGIWRIRQYNSQDRCERDSLEVGDIPQVVKKSSFIGAVTTISMDKPAIPKDVLNAPPLIAEINDHIKRLNHEPHKNNNAHVINLSLLPQTESDIKFLHDILGTGTCSILSRGYGNCRITATNTANVWWVQYFNSQDSNILNSLEIVEIPQVACAAEEDIEDSLQRLGEILEAYR